MSDEDFSSILDDVLSEYRNSFEDPVKVAIAMAELSDMRSELARLRAVDEAWRAVRHVYEAENFNLYTCVRDQIARLDQLKGEVIT